VGIVFKGSGFYATDHRSPSGMNAKSESKEEKATATEKPAETKPAETKTTPEKSSKAESKSSPSEKE
jgi:hypothetical protein